VPWPAAAPPGRAFAADEQRSLRRLGVRLADEEWARRLSQAPGPPAVVAPVAPEAREAAALGWLVEWCRLSALAGRPGRCRPSAERLRSALDDPAAQAAWAEAEARLAVVPDDGRPDAALERALARVLEILT
jgi:hypothetical protein